jgi:hypothetical protein
MKECRSLCDLGGNQTKKLITTESAEKKEKQKRMKDDESFLCALVELDGKISRSCFLRRIGWPSDLFFAPSVPSVVINH